MTRFFHGLLLSILVAALLPAGFAVAEHYGEDDEELVADAMVYPHSAACWVHTQLSNGSWHRCSGVMIHPYHALTSAQCVYRDEWGGWVEVVEVYPAMNEGNWNYGRAYSTNVEVLDGWIGGEATADDIALITLDRKLGEHSGVLGYEALGSSGAYIGQTLGSNHYPETPIGDDLQMWHSEDEVVDADASTLMHHLDMADGSIGAALYRTDGQDHFVQAIHSVDIQDTWHVAARLTDARVAWIDGHIAAADEPDDLPDLTAGPCMVSPGIIKAGETFTLSVRPSNTGTVDSPAFNVRFHASVNPDVNIVDDEILDVIEVPAMAAFGNPVQQWVGTMPNPAPIGTMFIAYIMHPLDDVVEASEGDQIGVCDNTVIIQPATPTGDDDDDTSGDDDDDAEDCSCSAAPTPRAASAAVLLVLLGLLIRRR